ncbi:hypothetical protein PT974_07760 [Cladobotryum mycophilum]|uniref:CHAT domain-containing protein n=1 Tax=Cladobotryum mycophilum TaxID=491253 RepID=A0ABR0SIQ3_9HYPO
MARPPSLPPASEDSSLEELHSALQRQRSLIETASPDDQELPLLLDTEGSIYYYKYLKTSLRDDIEQAVRSARAALQALPPPDADGANKRNRGIICGHLSGYLITVFQYAATNSVDLDYVNEALSLGRSALGLLLKGSEQWWSVLMAQAKPFSLSARQVFTLQQLDEAIELQKAAFGVDPMPHTLASQFLGGLNCLFSLRYEMSGDMSYLEQAIGHGYQALEMLKYADAMITEYTCLSASLLHRYQATSSLSSLEEALRISRLGTSSAMKVRQMPREKAAAFMNHGAILDALRQRFRETDPPQAFIALGGAIECGDAALKLLEDDKSEHAYILNMMGAWYSEKMKMTQDVAFGEQAAQILGLALESLPTNHHEYPKVLDNLVHVWDVQHQIMWVNGQRQPALEALNKAIDYAYAAVKSSYEHHPSHGPRLKNLAVLLCRKFQLTEDETARLEAKKYLELTVGLENAHPLTRIPCTIQAALFCKNDEIIKANNLLQKGLSLLPGLNLHSISSQDLQQALSQVAGLATFAAAVSLKAKRPLFEAVKSLEEARCVISGLAMSSNQDLSGLREINADLADTYEDLRKKLANDSKRMTVERAFRQARLDQAKHLQALLETEAEIRKLPGWESFQLPLTEKDVVSLASEGPIIVVNATKIGNSALIVTTQGIKHLLLEDMTYGDLEHYIGLLDKLGNEARRNAVPRKAKIAKEAASDAMMWLWRVAVRPILDSVELTASKRVWWLTTGLAGRAPFHAAGDHSPRSQDNTLSRVVSSYISSFKALKFARERNQATLSKLKMLLVTMSSNPPPHHNLNTAREERVVQEVFGDSMEHLSHPSTDKVLQKLPGHSVVHFACHGSSISYDPSRSGLLLAKDGNAAMLTISDLEKNPMTPGSIVYLSACSTAEQVDGKYADEAIHLANSFQSLGFPHVVGSMWGADDEAAGEIARRFYTNLFREIHTEGGAKDFHLNVASALHEATVQYMREVGGPNVTKWAPFVHIGA